MENLSARTRRVIEGRPALIVVDIQALTFDETIRHRAIPNMPGYKDRMLKARRLIDKAREQDIPVIFIQEVHRPGPCRFRPRA